MASQTSFTDEQAMRQLAAEAPFLLSTQSEKTAERMLDKSDFWAVVMRGHPTLADHPSLLDSRPERPQVKDETPNEHIQERPRRNPPRAAKTQDPLLTDMRPDSRQRVEDNPLDEHVPKRPRLNPPRATHPQEQESCSSPPVSRPKRPAEDEAPDEHKPKRAGGFHPRIPAGACPYSRPSLPTRELIVEAILSSPQKQMSIKDMKLYLQNNYPWFTWGSARRNVCATIRSALGTRRLMKRLEEVPEQQGYWRVRAKYLRYLR